MFVEDLDGNTYQWKMNGREIVVDKRPRSSLHVKAREILKNKFPTMQLLEEVSFKVKPRQTLYLDFFLPLIKVAVEVHGEQHFKFNSMYHSSANDFLQQKKNDRDKSQWCEINGIELVILSYNTVDKWEAQLA